jgi:hypothetical protein
MSSFQITRGLSEMEMSLTTARAKILYHLGSVWIARLSLTAVTAALSGEICLGQERQHVTAPDN